MADRKDWSDSDLDRIWNHSYGNSSSGYCPKKNCPYTTPMKKSNYGNDSNTDWVVDHITPISKGGKNTLDNLQPMHNSCNEEKSDNIE